MRKSLIIIVNLSILALVVIWATNNISLIKVWEEVRSLPIPALTAALALNMAVIVFYGMRLSILLSARWSQSSAIVLIGFGMNNVLPFRLGELAKLAYAKQLFNVNAPRLIMATAAEKFLDLSALLIMGVIASQIAVAPYLDRGIAMAFLLVLALVLICIMASWLWKKTRAQGGQLATWIGDAFSVLQVPRKTTYWSRLATLTSLIWLITVGSIYLLFTAVFPDFSPVDGIVLTLILALAIAIPGAPAGLGVVEAALVGYLHQVLQAEPNQALACALAFRLIVAIPQIIGAVVIIAMASIRAKHTI